jgi:hypothetical protein
MTVKTEPAFIYVSKGFDFPTMFSVRLPVSFKEKSKAEIAKYLIENQVTVTEFGKTKIVMPNDSYNIKQIEWFLKSSPVKMSWEVEYGPN